MKKNKNNRADIKHPEELHEEVYSLIDQHLGARNEYFWVVAAIKDIRKALWEKYELSSREIQHHVYLKFMEQGILEQYDPTLSSLKTYTAHQTLGKIRDMRKSYDRIYGKNHFKMLKVFHSNNTFFAHNNFSVRYEDEPIGKPPLPKPDEKLYTKDQVAIFNRLIEYKTPEDILIDKEATVIVHEYFDETDILVLEDLIDRKQAAERLSLSYEAYCKQLQRKINSFKILAARAGYC
jgi:hypothetical protein